MAAAWSPLAGASRSVRSVQATTEAAPVSADDGLNLDVISAVTISLDAGPGETITGDVGQADVYRYDDAVAIWEIVPQLVFPVPPGASGKRRVSLGTILIDNPRGRLAVIANGMSVSGASLILDMQASKSLTGGACAV
jgi:hypothetical protein